MPRDAADDLYPGVIHGDAVYWLGEFKRRMRMQDQAVRTAKANGLKTHECGNRTYVIGRDWIAFLTGAGSAEPHTGA